MENREQEFHIGQLIQVLENIEPESEFWEKGYWVIPKGHFSIIRDIDNGLYLIEYIDATFYVEGKFLQESPLKQSTNPHLIK
jgi:hypothetical protein